MHERGRDCRAALRVLHVAAGLTISDVATASIRSIRSLEDVLALSLSGRRANVRRLEVFGQAAVLLAGIGV
jgi:hypothetical protein